MPQGFQQMPGQQSNQQLPPQIQQQAEQVTAVAMSLLHNPANKIEQRQLPNTYTKNRGSQGPKDAGPKTVADVTVWVLKRVDNQIKQRGKTVDPLALLLSIGLISEQVAEIATTANIFQISPDDLQVATAWAASAYTEVVKKDGRVSEKDLVDAARSLQEKYPEEINKFQQMVQSRQSGSAQTDQGLLTGDM